MSLSTERRGQVIELALGSGAPSRARTVWPPIIGVAIGAGLGAAIGAGLGAAIGAATGQLAAYAMIGSASGLILGIRAGRKSR